MIHIEAISEYLLTKESLDERLRLIDKMLLQADRVSAEMLGILKGRELGYQDFVVKTHALKSDVLFLYDPEMLDAFQRFAQLSEQTFSELEAEKEIEIIEHIFLNYRNSIQQIRDLMA